MKSVYIKLVVNGTWCNDWQNIKVVFNDSIYFQGSIQDCKTIEFEAPVCQSNTLIIQHYDKKFGENGQWDTRSNGSEITHDRPKKVMLKIDN